MKKRKAFLCLLLILVMLTQGLIPGLALTATEEWKAYYELETQEHTAFFINPGSNETERNFSWYSALTALPCKVLISESKDFEQYKTFTGNAVLTAEGDRRNRVTVSGLKPETTYYYRCYTGDTLIKENSFTTISPDSFQAMYVTDIHITRKEDDLEDSLIHQSYTASEVIAEAVYEHGAQFVISAGDQATYGDRREYESLALAPVLSQVPFALCVGNHDRKGVAYKCFNNNPNRFTDGISSLIGNDYWYREGNVLFMVFDSNNTAALSHRRFMEDAIKKNMDAQWRIAVMHHDLYGRLSDSRLEDANENRRPVFTELFDEFQVDLALLGHSHYYSVSNAVFGGKTVQEFENGVMTNAKGTVYMVSNSVNHPRDTENALTIEPVEQNAVAIQKDGATYSILCFSGSNITVSSYEAGASEPFYTYTLQKTAEGTERLPYERTAAVIIKQILLEISAFFTEFGEGIAGIWKNYFDKA